MINYINNRTKIKIICLEHGEFLQRSSNHLQGKGFPKCSRIILKPELEICSFLDKSNIDYKQSDRSVIKLYELDIVIPSKKLVIEFNSVY